MSNQILKLVNDLSAKDLTSEAILELECKLTGDGKGLHLPKFREWFAILKPKDRTSFVNSLARLQQYIVENKLESVFPRLNKIITIVLLILK